jgi:hypothetical protein
MPVSVRRMREDRRMPRTTYPLLDRSRLNRATLARQLLLERSDLEVVPAIEQIGGMQAQEPASPFIGLWTRLAGFDAGALRRAFQERQAVKTSLMRVTLHAVSARDYPSLIGALLPMLRGTGTATRRGVARPERIPAIAAEAARFAAEPRSNVELRAFILERTDGDPLDTPLWWWIRRHLPLIHVPDDVPWSFSRRPVLVTPGAWLGDPRLDEGAAVPMTDALTHVLRRYLGAFGPASTADVAAWSGLSATTFAAAVGRLEEAGELERFQDDMGRVLLDLRVSPRPEADVPALPRLLPMWDSTLLAFRDRTRVIDDELRPIVIAKNGDVLPTILVDGRVAGFWWAELDGAHTRIVLEPFGTLSKAERQGLEAEADRLARFVEPLEPRVYARYRMTKARRT